MVHIFRNSLVKDTHCVALICKHKNSCCCVKNERLELKREIQMLPSS